MTTADKKPMLTCEFCGNNDAAYAVCSDCLRVQPEAIADVLAIELGGVASDYDFLSARISQALG